MIQSLQKTFAIIWLAIVIAMGTFCAVRLLDESTVRFDLLGLLPQEKNATMRLAKEFMEDGNLYGRIVIAFGHEDQEISKQALQQFRRSVGGMQLPIVEQDIKQIATTYKNFFTALYPFRAGLLSKNDRKLLSEGHDEKIVKEALGNILSPTSTFSSSQLDSDPFGFYPRFAASLISENSLRTDFDGNLTMMHEDKTWHIFQGNVTSKIFSLKLQEEISESLQPLLLQIENERHVEIVRTGAAFFAAAGAQTAQREISLIGFLSTLGIIVLFLMIFRDLRPILLALAVISSGLLCGLATCIYLFKSIHILALLFGCSLTGVAVDYVIHYYFASFKTENRFAVLKSLLPAMPLGVLTSAIGYGALAAAPFPGIQQMALIACIGLLCTFIGVSVWGPYFISPEHKKIPAFADRCVRHLERFSKIGTKSYIKPSVTIALLALFGLGTFGLKYDDNVRNFQSPDTRLKRQEERIKTMMNLDRHTAFIAVNDPSLENLLQTQEAIAVELDTRDIPYRALSDLIPSQKRRQENSDRKLNFCKDNFPKIAELLKVATRFDPEKSGFGKKAQDLDRRLLDALPTGWKELIHVGDDGSITGRILLDSRLQPELEKYPTATFIDPPEEYSRLFSSYRERMILLLIGLLIGFMLPIGCSQGIRAAFKTTFPVLLSLSATTGIIGLSGIGFTLFHAMGLVLVLCIGIDYALFLYWKRSKEEGLLLLGNASAAVTTILSFGLLALSGTASIHSFGMTVFSGITLNFFLTTLYLGHSECKN